MEYDSEAIFIASTLQERYARRLGIDERYVIDFIAEDKKKSNNRSCDKKEDYAEKRRKEWDDWEEYKKRTNSGVKKMNLEGEFMNKSNIGETVDRTCNQIVACLNRGIKIKQDDGYHQMTRYEIRNYMNSHNVESINKETLFEFFGSNIYDTVEGCKHYFTHEICSCRYDIVKICKALEAAFPFLGPNTGDLNYGENYFQTFMFNYIHLGCNKFNEDIQIFFIETLLELGFQYGLDPQYRTHKEGNTMWHYLCLSIDKFKVLEHIFNSLKNKKFDSLTQNFDKNDFIDYIFARVTNVYSQGSLWADEFEEFYNLEKGFLIELDARLIPVIYFHTLDKKKFAEINKRVDEGCCSLWENYREVADELNICKLNVDPLLSRFLIKYNFLGKKDAYIYYDDIFPEEFLCLESEFSLSGYGTLDYFLEFYNRLYWDFSYNRDGVETINTLKRILKKEEKKDNKE